MTMTHPATSLSLLASYDPRAPSANCSHTLGRVWIMPTRAARRCGRHRYSSADGNESPAVLDDLDKTQIGEEYGLVGSTEPSSRDEQSLLFGHCEKSVNDEQVRVMANGWSSQRARYNTQQFLPYPTRPDTRACTFMVKYSCTRLFLT